MTVIRIVWPTSSLVSVYVFAVAPLIVAHALPLALQRPHAYVYEVGLLFHVPLLPVSCDP